ncbi:MAG: DUF2914 domain-containing protein [Desulfobacterales bacterium]|mgnify:FL=1|jgi:hypothetical protein
MRCRYLLIWIVCVGVNLLFLLPFQTAKTVIGAEPSKLELFEALMCEDIFANAPRNPTAVFSIKRKKAVFFTSFSTVPQKLIIYHNWYHRDVPSAKIRLTLKPPRWSTYSSIELNKSDIGPWRVEITDESGNVLEVLRFSVTE